jgi:hypothetical protein
MAAFIDAQGATQQFEVNLDLVREAGQAGLSVRDHVNTLLTSDVRAYGDPFSQLCESEGIVLVPSRKYGVQATSLKTVLEGRQDQVRLEAGTVVRQPSNQARILLMPAIGALIEDKLLADLDMNANAFDNMIAQDETIADEWLLWPEVNMAGAEAGRSQVTSQLAKPARMMSITTSEKQIRIPTFALGIEWSEQSSKYVKLDLIALAIARQVAIERNERANTNLLNILNGDADVGQASLASLGKVTTALSLDAAATAGITQMAWVSWLYKNSTKRRLGALVTNIAGAMAIENRTGRPVVTNDNPTSARIDSTVSVMNPTWAPNLPIFIVDPSVGWPDKTIMGLDINYGLHRVSSTNAEYAAQEDFVLRRAHAMRWDFGQIVRRLYTDAFEVLTYA